MKASRTLPTVVILALLLGLVPGTAAGSDSGVRQRGAATVTRVGAAADPITAAIAISQATFASGAAYLVTIGRDDVFADNLAGASLSGPNGPLLYVPGGPDGSLPPEVRDEVARLLPPPAGDCTPQTFEVVLLGGVQAVSAAIENELTATGWCVLRVAGASRVQTAIGVADVAVAGLVPQVMIARADDWADAATGGAWSAASGFPVLVTPTDSLHPDVEAWLQEHSEPTTDIVLLGGTAALSETVQSQAAAYGTVRRIAGAARDETAARIAAELWPAEARSGAVTLVNGYIPLGWTYALAGASFAAQNGAPELYVQANTVPPGTLEYVDDNPPTAVFAVGSFEVLSDAVAQQVATGAPATEPVPTIPFDTVTALPQLVEASAVTENGFRGFSVGGQTPSGVGFYHYNYDGTPREGWGNNSYIEFTAADFPDSCCTGGQLLDMTAGPSSALVIVLEDVVIRLTEAGVPDPAYAHGGFAPLPGGAIAGAAYGRAESLEAGTTWYLRPGGPEGSTQLARLDEFGNPHEFAATGAEVVTLPFPALDVNIVNHTFALVAGGSQVAAVDVTGALDSNFGNGGIVDFAAPDFTPTAIRSDESSWGHAVIVTGTTSANTIEHRIYFAQRSKDFTITGYGPDYETIGGPDVSIGGLGTSNCGEGPAIAVTVGPPDDRDLGVTSATAFNPQPPPPIQVFAAPGNQVALAATELDQAARVVVGSESGHGVIVLDDDQPAVPAGASPRGGGC